LAETHTSALLILKDGEIRHEQYWPTGGRDVQWISFSVAKSFVSALVGGGGYGRPELRDPLKLLEDVSERLISRERAREVYRVAIPSDLTVDPSATAALRSQ
jgi:N-methylhydantoinase B/oxoprolinase/acetone carboxylase alpha subunit